MIISDVCNTLYDSNTTFDYIKFVLEKENQLKKLKKVNSFDGKYHPRNIFSYVLNKLVGIDYAKSLAVKQLKGLSKEELDAYAVQFFNEVLSKKQINIVFKKIKSLNEEHIVLASASLEPIIQEISNRLNAKSYACSTLEYDNGISTGKIKQEAKGKKLDLLKEKMVLSNDYTFISDNFSDKNIMKTSSNPIAVVYNEKSNHFWEEIGCELIKMY